MQEHKLFEILYYIVSVHWFFIVIIVIPKDLLSSSLQREQADREMLTHWID